MLADRVAAGSAQLAKLQSDVQLQQVRLDASQSANNSNNNNSSTVSQHLGILPPTTPLSVVMQNQVEEVVASRLRASEQRMRRELESLERRWVSDAEASSALAVPPQALVDAVSSHLAQFKHEVEAQQTSVLCRFTESMVKDSVQLDARVQRVEAQVERLETVIQAEQQASLLALEAISDAFASGGNASSDASGSPASVGHAHDALERRSSNTSVRRR